TPAEFDAICEPQARQAVGEIIGLFTNGKFGDWPDVVMVTHDASFLPGLVVRLENEIGQRTDVRFLNSPASAAD
ncbi:hypothetical protein, partial [Zavarzinella formosa]|uniref:hypothetical protein n=1 Tax=Zavarzinella formosa TaxID=360055 RepID=UPI00187D6EB9